MSDPMLRNPEPDRQLLVDHLRRAFPHLEEHPGTEGGIAGLAARARWDHVLGCWTTTAWNMVVGIERDGYVHS